MKKALLVSLAIGILLGILQAYYVRRDVKIISAPVYKWELCGPTELCFPDDSPPISYREEQITENERQGFPISQPGVYEFNPVDIDTYDKQMPLFANFVIFLLGVPLIAYLGYKLVSKNKK